MQPVKDFKVTSERGELPALEVLPNADQLRRTADDPDKAEHFVGVRWLDTVDEANALNEVGLFGNQNTVCQPRTAKWRHTVDRLKAQFSNWQG